MILEFLNHLWPFILVIIVLVTIHEFGHYFAARKCGIHVEAFSIGFGPVIYSKKDKNGTEWRLSALPLGGYIKMLGEYEESNSNTKSSTKSNEKNNFNKSDVAKDPLNNEEGTIHKKSSLSSKSPLQKFFVAVAGPAANFISAIIVSIAVSAFIGIPTPNTTIKSVKENSIAFDLGIQPNDEIISVYIANPKASQKSKEESSDKKYHANSSGAHTKDAKSIEGHVTEKATNPQEVIHIIRSGKEAILTIKRKIFENQSEVFDIKLNDTGPNRMIGISFNTSFKKSCVTNSILHGLVIPFQMASANFKGVYSIVTGKAPSSSISGPVKIAQIIRSAASSVASILMIFIILSIGLACMNMIPLPGLDGGTALISIIEMLTKKNASEKIIVTINAIGMIIISLITVLVMYNDISQLSIIKKIFG